jgi:hypothetical protein
LKIQHTNEVGKDLSTGSDPKPNTTDLGTVSDPKPSTTDLGTGSDP